MLGSNTIRSSPGIDLAAVLAQDAGLSEEAIIAAGALERAPYPYGPAALLARPHSPAAAAAVGTPSQATELIAGEATAALATDILAAGPVTDTEPQISRLLTRDATDSHETNDSTDGDHA